MLRGILLLLAAVVCLHSPIASAESDHPPGEFLRVEIGASEVSPPRLEVEPGRVFVLENRSSGLARVEFALARGVRIPCAQSDGTVSWARRFLIDHGDSLVCSPPTGRYDYTVFRNVREALTGRFVPRRSQGSVEVR